ncbi:hypothetical protein PRN20_01965 [Devosia sp. ZB163]|uniref:hypothetical protein n=1 Tax=Devosia sp. ZB163 TaxID=3025938 RepID=UPI0023603FDC|nr:hypothetical protein [Devosia sp. ZB163]MDC9822485.1 hypothetical protein [Devosia sp. ZB163]
MSDELWPAIKVERFYDEPLAHYETRRGEIVTIINGFRRGRYEGEAAERMERRLVALQDGTVLPAVA